MAQHRSEAHLQRENPQDRNPQILWADAQEFLRNRRAVKKTDDGLAMLDVLYADEHHLNLPPDTLHGAFNLAIESIRASRALLVEGEQEIERNRTLFAVR